MVRTALRGAQPGDKGEEGGSPFVLGEVKVEMTKSAV